MNEPVKCASCGRLAAATFDTCPFCRNPLVSAKPPRVEPAKCDTCGRLFAPGLAECPFCNPSVKDRPSADRRPVGTTPEPAVGGMAARSVRPAGRPVKEAGALDRWLGYVALPFELVVYAMARLSNKGWGMLMLLLLIAGALIAFLSPSAAGDKGPGVWIGGTVAVMVLMTFARTHLGRFPLGSQEVNYPCFLHPIPDLKSRDWSFILHGCLWREGSEKRKNLAGFGFHRWHSFSGVRFAFLPLPWLPMLSPSGSTSWRWRMPGRCPGQ